MQTSRRPRSLGDAPADELDSAGRGSTPSATSAASMSARTRARKVASASRARRARRSPAVPEAAPAPPATQPGGGGGNAQELSDAFFVVSAHRSLRPLDAVATVISSLEAVREDARGSGRCGSRSFRREARAPRRSCGSSRPGRRSGRAPPGTPPRAPRVRVDVERLFELVERRPRLLGQLVGGRLAGRGRMRSMHSRLVSCAIHGRRAAGIAERVEPVEDAA